MTYSQTDTGFLLKKSSKYTERAKRIISLLSTGEDYSKDVDVITEVISLTKDSGILEKSFIERNINHTATHEQFFYSFSNYLMPYGRQWACCSGVDLPTPFVHESWVGILRRDMPTRKQVRHVNFGKEQFPFVMKNGCTKPIIEYFLSLGINVLMMYILVIFYPHNKDVNYL